MKKTGFTLAEILITIGILGVIAALTIPALIAGYERQTTASTLKKGVSIIANAIEMAEANDMMLDPNSTGNQLMEQIRPYLDIVTRCENTTGCGLVNTTDYNGGSTLKLNTTDSRYVLANGTVIGAKKSADSDDIWVYFDVNGEQKPNKMGFDTFMMRFVYNENTHNYTQAQMKQFSGSDQGTCDNEKKKSGEDCGEFVRSQEYKITYR